MKPSEEELLRKLPEVMALMCEDLKKYRVCAVKEDGKMVLRFRKVDGTHETAL